MAPDKLRPNDPRVESCTAQVNGKTYHYLLGNPAGGQRPIATIILLHGWPDLSLGWRYQVPQLLARRLRVVIPDLPGYGRTDAPQDLKAYSFRSVAADVAELARQVTSSSPSAGSGSGADANPERVLIGGHDWGGFLAWRLPLWHPELVRAVFSVCTPYAPPNPTWIDGEAMATRLPSLRYQLQLAGPDVEAGLVGRDKLRSFLAGMYGAKGPAGERVFSTDKGVALDNVDRMGDSPLLNAEELDYYADEYARKGMRGPLNWYRTRRVNYEEELSLVAAGKTRIEMPALLITASKDIALPPAMAAGMDRHFDRLAKREVNAGHWALWEAADEVNKYIWEFLADVLGEDGIKASI